MRFRLRTLLIALALLPPVLAGLWVAVVRPSLEVLAEIREVQARSEEFERQQRLAAQKAVIWKPYCCGPCDVGDRINRLSADRSR